MIAKQAPRHAAESLEESDICIATLVRQAAENKLKDIPSTRCAQIPTMVAGQLNMCARIAVLAGGLSLLSCLKIHAAVNTPTVAASDATFLGSVLDETWDISHAVSSGYIDCMMPASDVDLTVKLSTPGPVSLDFDRSVYNPKQNPGAGPRWSFEVDGIPTTNIVTMGPATGSISTGALSPGTHRVRFVQIGNTSGSARWAADDPQLSRVIGVT